ncbi:hypothetical protein Bpfe_010530 [Biomphalaria pfeifferi]|uniref:Uncharacterized protein n=1 Tax=Biomphalaria pfeifferi TaxID=112525 RepID=A0AAD8FCK2_BIOPF|nr:hypothetical protein Bpfe_010530 [Biomphalaria pfeifferi]
MTYSSVGSLLVLVVIATVQAQRVDEEILANANSVIHSLKKAVKTQSYFRFFSCLCLKSTSCISLTDKVTNNDRVVYLITNSTADKSFVNREKAKSLTLFRVAASAVAMDVLHLNFEEASRTVSAHEKISSTKLSSLQMRCFHPIKCWRHSMFLIACRLHASTNTVEEKLLERKKRANLAALNGMMPSMRTTSLTKEETHRFISYSSHLGTVLLSIAALISLCLTCLSCILCRLHKNTQNECMNAEDGDGHTAQYENNDTLNFHLNTSESNSKVPAVASLLLQSASVSRLRPPSPSQELDLSARSTSLLDEEGNNLSPQIYSYCSEGYVHDVALTAGETSERDHYIQEGQQSPTRSDNLPHIYNNVHPQNKHGLLHSKSDLNHCPTNNKLKTGSYSDTCLQLHDNTTSETYCSHVYSKPHQYQRNFQDNYNKVATTGQKILIVEETQCSKHDIDISYQVSGRESEISLDIVEHISTQRENDYINSDLIVAMAADSCSNIDRPEIEEISKFKFRNVISITEDVYVNSQEIDVPPPNETSDESLLNDVDAAIRSNEHNERQLQNVYDNSRSSDLYVNSHLWKKSVEIGLDSKRLIHVDVDDSVRDNSVESLSENSQNVYVCFDSLFLNNELNQLENKTILVQDKKKYIDEVTKALGCRGLTDACQREKRLTEKDLSFEVPSDMGNNAGYDGVPYEENNADDDYYSNSDLVTTSTGNSFLEHCHDNLSVDSEMNTNTKATSEHKGYDLKFDNDIYFNTDLLSKINRDSSFSSMPLTSEDSSFKCDSTNDCDVTFACIDPNPKTPMDDHYKSGNDCTDLVKPHVETSSAHKESFSSQCSEQFDLNNKAFGNRFTLRTGLDHKYTSGNYCNISFATSSTENIFANNTSQSVQRSSETGNNGMVDNGKLTSLGDSPDDDCDYVNSDIFIKLNSPAQQGVMSNNDTSLAWVDVNANEDSTCSASVCYGSDNDVASDYYFNSDIFTELKQGSYTGQGYEEQDLTGIRHYVELDTDQKESLDKDSDVDMSNGYYFNSDIMTTLPQDIYSNHGKGSIEEQDSKK